MTRPAWAPTCTCGETPLGYFCYPCHAWAGSSHGEQASWSRPRLTPEKAPDGGADGADQEPQGSGTETPGTLYHSADAAFLAGHDHPVPAMVRCTNGRYARPARQGEKLLPCGCPLGGAPRECIDAVATKTVTVKRRGLEH